MTIKSGKTIVLVGIMGAGKTSIGRKLAEKLKMPFIDIDAEIEKREGQSVSSMFETKGEEYFRRKEKEVIGEFLGAEPYIIAPGGGAFMNNETRRLIKDLAISIWLRAELDILVERVSRRNTRPLLEKGDKREIMKKLMDERYPVYKEADIIVDSTDSPHEAVIRDIIKKLGRYEQK